ncbi:uncharacterized protein LOC133524755 [Cydia pomonella]|uniref:uncharacterized protein LOC133524755 n=1 Tax=Cydia pomonella TaxID=82600 RepID=UPI002ADD744B|nr:uncharacterized protein LOC133524755 [Cydia pomonella]
MRRRKTTTGQAAQNVKTWKYEAVMSFLLPQSVNDSTISNFSNNSQDNSTSNNNTPATNMTAESQPPPTESPLSQEKSSTSLLPPPESPFPPSGSASPPLESSNPPSGSTPVTTNTTRLGKTSRNRVLTSVTELLENRDRRREQRQTERDDFRRKLFDMNRASQDALSNMLSSFCEKTRQLPKYLQVRVERQIFDIVSRAEEEALTFDSVNNYYRPTSSTSSYGYSSGTQYQLSPLPDNTRDTQHDDSRDVSAETPPQVNTTPYEPQEDSDSLPDISAAFNQ